MLLQTTGLVKRLSSNKTVKSSDVYSQDLQNSNIAQSVLMSTLKTINSYSKQRVRTVSVSQVYQPMVNPYLLERTAIWNHSGSTTMSNAKMTSWPPKRSLSEMAKFTGITVL